MRWLALLALAGCATPPADAMAVRLMILCGTCPVRVFVIDEGKATGVPEEIALKSGGERG
jgi:hypothetical protein